MGPPGPTLCTEQWGLQPRPPGAVPGPSAGLCGSVCACTRGFKGAVSLGDVTWNGRFREGGGCAVSSRGRL